MENEYATSELNFTYYLGAGASAQALPTVLKLPESFRALANEIRINDKIDSTYLDAKKFYADRLEWLATNSEKYGTIDTFAKFLYLRNSTDFEHLKKTINFFFALRQGLDGYRDPRALIFLTTVMKIDQFFPPNINIISWNYDFQIELAAEEFRKESFATLRTGGFRHSPPVILYYPNVGAGTSREFQLIHLNGIAGLFRDEVTNVRKSHLHNTPFKDINDFFEKTEARAQHSRVLSFAFEAEEAEQRLTYAKQLVQNTDILVVIGYSFPYFNRDIDKAIFEMLKENKRLKIIYFQNPILDGQFLYNQFGINKNEVDIRHDKSDGNYFIPFEL
ncbi:MAG TPA: hypothetical protein VK796_00595 [Cytophaga sp.]|jgi:hypothetical protein|nr:hypothetical protein [Cytophaga sp.]